MNFSYVIGNGVSRRKIPSKFYQQKDTYGCNLAYKDIELKNLVVCDRFMFTTALSQNAHLKTTIWTRSRWLQQISTENVFALPQIPYKPEIKHDLEMNWGSGLYAALLAAGSDSDVIVLIGYDLWPLPDGNVNNIYAGESGYGPKEAAGVDPSGWIHQFSKLFSFYDEKQFVFINEKNWNVPEQWLEYKNFNFDHFSALNKL